MTEKVLTPTRLRDLLDYDPATGVFVWKSPQSNRVHAGDEAGVVAANGRRYISVDGARLMAHQLAWLYVTGEWPAENLAALDGDYLNTRFANLKPQSVAETARKGGARRSGASGLKGVSFDKSRGKWVASITRNYKQVNLGRFATKEEAHAAYLAAADEPPAVVNHDAKIAAASVRARYLQRQLWKRTVSNAGGIVGWDSLGEFIADVGEPVAGKVIVASDPSRPVGPGNFIWIDPPSGFDFSTSEGRAAYQRAHRETHRDLYRDKDLRKTFGITLVEYQRMHAAQDGKCAICGEPERSTRNGKPKALAVDHCHNGGGIRALLCSNCNPMIGYALDRPAVLRRAASYLERHARPTVRLNPGFPGFREHVIPMKEAA